MGRFTRRAYHVGDVVPPAFAPALSKINLFKGRGGESLERRTLEGFLLYPLSYHRLPGGQDLNLRHDVVLPASAATFTFHFVSTISTSLTISTQSFASPLAKRAIASNTASVKPPTFMMSLRVFACVEP